MKIDYVVISSDENPMYADFYNVVASQWNRLGFKVLYLQIVSDIEKDSGLVETQYGLAKLFKAVPNISPVLQAQVVRLYASKVLPSNNLLISDMDMLPLNGSYFTNEADKVNIDRILIYSGAPYMDVPYYPMCYILGKGVVMSQHLHIEDKFEDFVIKMSKYNGGAWNTDEKYVYDKLNNRGEVIVLRTSRTGRGRIDRSNWNYDLAKLKAGYYIDSHLLKPYSKYKNEIDKLLVMKDLVDL